MRRAAQLILLALLLGTAAVSCAVSWADGPHIAFHGAAGPYTVTVFSAPDPLVTGPVRLVLLVQRSTDGTLMQDATASGEAALPGHTAVPVLFRRGAAGNPHLPGAVIPLSSPGSWSLSLRVRAPKQSFVHISVSLPVAENHGRRDTVIWAVSLLGLSILLFLANQYGKQKLRSSV